MYIKKQPLLDKCKSLAGGAFSTPLIIEAIEKAEGLDIVFCKECIHRSTDDFRSFYCRKDDVGCKDDDFCSEGERGNAE